MTMLLLRWVLLVLLTVLMYASKAQKIAGTTSEDELIISYRLWTDSDGLPSWDISGIFFDSRGYIWMQAASYILRFDGIQFVYVDTIAREQKNEVVFLEDVNGNIWYKYSNRGDTSYAITIVNPILLHKIKFFDYVGIRHPNLKYHNGIDFYSVNNIVYLFIAKTNTLFWYDGEWHESKLDKAYSARKDYFFLFPGFYSSVFWGISIDSKVSLVNRDGVPFKDFDMKDRLDEKMYYANGNVYTYGLNPDKPDYLKSRLLYQNLAAPHNWQQTIPQLYHLPGWGMFQQDTVQSLTYYINQNKQLMCHNNVSSVNVDVLNLIGAVLGENLDLNSKSVSKVLFTKDHMGLSVFMVVKKIGLIYVKLQRKRFLTMGMNRSYRTLIYNGDNEIFATDATEVEKKFYVVNTNDWTISPQAVNEIPQVLTILDDKLWVSVRKKEIHMLDGNNRVKRKVKTEDQVFLLKSINDSTLWFSFDKNIYALNDRTNAIRTILKTETKPMWVHKALNGDYWVATQNGLYHMPTKQRYLQDAINGQPLEIQHIYESPDGNFWLSTMRGLIKWQPFTNKLQLFDKRIGMRSTELHAAYPDRLGRLWLSSNNGIIAFDTATRSVLNFTVADGLACNEQNYLAHCQTPDGMLYFGGVSGITAFNPNTIKKPPLQKWNTLHITNVDQYAAAGALVAAQGLGVSDSGQIALNKEGMHATVQFSLPHYGAVKPSLQWRIKGLYPNWAALDITQPLLIYGIPHGNSTLEVRAEDPIYAGVYETWQFPIYKPFYWYQLFWVRILFFVLAVVLVFMGVRSWLYLQRKRERELEKIVHKRTETITTQNKTLEQIDTAKTQLFNNISHEFRTPLSLIKAMSGQIKKQLQQPQSLLTSVQQIDMQVDKLTGMLNDVMDLSKMQMGALQVKPVAVDWPTFLTRIFAGFDGLARKKKIDYRLQILPSESHFIMLDVKMVERVLTNLLGNAFKFTPDVGRILVESIYAHNTLTVRVQDSGPGVSPEEAETIFQRFVQGSASKKTPQPGYGIGLALCKEYTELLGGVLRLSSEKQSGATFILELPVTAAAEQTIKNKRQKSEEIVMPTAVSALSEDLPRLLVVEDNPDFLHYLQALLAEKYAVVAVNNGEEAWQYIQSDGRIALVLTDVMMPLIDGFTLLQKIRSHPQMGYLPVMFLTALTADDERLKALRLGVDAYCTKPFEEEEILTRIAHLVLRQQDRKQHIKNVETQVSAKDDKTEDYQAEEELSYDEVWMKELARVVAENLHKPNFKVPDLALLLHVSDRTLFNKIRQYTGQTPALYLRKARLDQAYHYLKTRRYQTVKEVAHATGFSKPRYFTLIFKEEFGITPAQAKWKLPR